MARPQLLQHLKHDEILTKNNFPQFVETWNYSVERLDNIKGDGDTDPLKGCINVDNTDPEHPVIRLNRNNLPKGGSGGVVGDGPFNPIYEDEDSDEVSGFEHCYWQCGGKTIMLDDQSLPGSTGFIALRAGATPATAGEASLSCYATLSALQIAQDELDYFTVPIYHIQDKEIDLDMRRMPYVQIAEVLL